MEDREIIDRYWARDEDAITASAEKYGAYCGTIARNVLTLPEDAEECVNDTWLHAWNEIPPTRPDCLRVFLGRLTRNLALTRWRWQHAQKRFAGMETLLSELEDCVPARGNVEAVLEQKRLTEILNAWLDALDGFDRRLFVRRYWYGVPVQTLAAEAGLRPNAVTQRLGRLRRKLRTTLESEGIAL